MPTSWKFLLVLLLALVASPARGGDGPVLEQVPQRWQGVFSALAPQADSKPSTPPLYQTSLTPTFFTPLIHSSRLRDLAPETDQSRTQGLLSSTTWLSGVFVTETEVAQSLGGTGWLQSGIPGDSPNNVSQRMFRLGLTGTNGSIRYGALYRSAELAFLNGPDQALREVWGEWKNGSTTVRSAFGQQWNNVAGDANRSRLEQTYGRVGLAWKRPIWPEISLTYAHNSLNSVLEPLSIAPQRSLSHSLEGGLAYAGTGWNARLVSSYILGHDLLRGGAETTARTQMFTAAFRPWNTLIISPTLGFRKEIQNWSGIQITCPSASIALQYRQSQQLLISALGNYAGTRSSDGLIDTEQMGGKGILSWKLQRSETWTTLIAFEAGYNHMITRTTPSTDSEDISGLIRIVLAAS